MPSAVWSARCHSGWWACVKSVAGDVRQRRAAAATGRLLVPTASADLRWLAGVALSWRRAAMEGTRWVAAYFRAARTCTPPHSQVSQTLPFARHWTNTPPAPLGLAPELQIHEICSVRRTRLVRYWMDNPLNPGKRNTSRQCPLCGETCAVESSSFLHCSACREPAAD